MAYLRQARHPRDDVAKLFLLGHLRQVVLGMEQRRLPQQRRAHHLRRLQSLE